jgi:hypothetical protein
MRIAVLVLLILGLLDLVAVGCLLALTWFVHRRQRRLAREAGEPVPPAATGQFAFLAALGSVGAITLFAAALFLFAE